MADYKVFNMGSNLRDLFLTFKPLHIQKKMRIKHMHEFELGPIRPPSEAYSVLLRVTRNCPWNKCAFCPVYKGGKFSLRSVEEIKADIDSMHYIVQRIGSRTYQENSTGYINEEIIEKLVSEDGINPHYLQQILFWMHFGMRSLFLQDADSMVLKPADLVDILGYIRSKFPTIERITCYTRSKTLVARSPEDLLAISKAGLNRIHIGMESGSDNVLRMINKGVKADEHISSGKKVIDAGFELSEYYMPGLGGRDYAEENAIETARVLNAINPSFIRIRTTTPVPGTELHKMMQRGEWLPMTEMEKVQEIYNMISALEGITSFIQSDHIMNLIEDANGKLPKDREAILAPLERFIKMDIEESECFIAARRTGSIRLLADYRGNGEFSELRERLVRSYGSIDNAAQELSGRTL